MKVCAIKADALNSIPGIHVVDIKRRLPHIYVTSNLNYELFFNSIEHFLSMNFVEDNLMLHYQKVESMY